MSYVLESITYFAAEGRENLNDCLRLAFAAAQQYGLEKIVIFTGIGDGVQQALDEYLHQPDYARIRIIGVTFPQGFEVKRDGEQRPHVFPSERKRSFAEQGIPIVRSHLPFNPISAQYQHSGVLAQDLSIVGNALNIFCGSLSLCVQAALIACDAGEVELGEHVIVMTSDTALLVRAAPTARLLTDFIVRQIICKPAFLTIAKAEQLMLPGEPTEGPSEIEGTAETKQLE